MHAPAGKIPVASRSTCQICTRPKCKIFTGQSVNLGLAKHTRKRVEEAFKAETSAIKALHETYKGERIARDEAEKNARYTHLQEVYIDFCVGNGVSTLIEYSLI